MTTKIQPANIDQTLDYTVDQLTANTVVAGGVDLYAFASSSFGQVNVSFAQANSAYTQANTSTSAIINIPSQFLLMGA